MGDQTPGSPDERTRGAGSSGASPGQESWAGTDRYRVVRMLGQGGMGVVYEALDRERGHPVAVKALLHFEPAALYRFKQEFRTLADVLHPNLVRLHEMIVAGDGGACFAMELVRGVDFLRHVTKENAGAAETLGDATRRHRRSERAPPGPGGPELRIADETRRSTPVDLEKLRPALRQLVEGVQALHTAGKLHRDIKPSNVLVAADGRVVILDFGVATELAPSRGALLADADEIVGTARYMAPEQALGEAPVPACDWYSVGVILYEALVGRPPFSGSEADVITQKMRLDPRFPADCVDGVPAELDALCRALLDRAPEQRPSGPEILQRLGTRRSGRPIPSLAPLVKVPWLVGREGQLRTLRDALERVASGQSLTVAIAGASGMGKSAVAQHFLDNLTETGEATILCGRTYERETIPYKAFDGVVDALTHHLLSLDEENAPVPLPDDVTALARIFPVLKRIPRIAEAPADQDADPLAVRQRAFRALRQLLGTLARRRPLVVYMDDVQWGDTDSAALLLELVRAPDAPPLLFLLTYRDNEAGQSAFLRAIRARWSGAAFPVDLVVGPLSSAEAASLAVALTNTAAPGSARVANAIARESKGSPFLIEELARTHHSALADSPGAMLTTVTLEQLVVDRLDRLPPSARRLLEIVAVAARPLPVPILAEASGAGDGTDDAIAAARARRFLHAGMRDGRDFVEMSHDRFRETIVSQLDPETVRTHHSSLARALEREPGADAEALAMHLIGAGDEARAATFAERAAADAIAKVALDQAERLLRMALDILPASSPDAARVQVQLGEVLVWAGRGAEGARVYLQAAETATVEQHVELQGAAAAQLLSCGRIDEGTAVLLRVLPAIGLDVPRSPAAALFWLIVYRIWGAIIGARYRKGAGSIASTDRVRIEALHAVSMGFAIIDVVLGACMQARHTVMALRRGDRAHALRALALETSHLASEGGPTGKRERALTDLATEITASIEADVARGGSAQQSPAEMEAPLYFRMNRAVALFLRGRWRGARALNDAANRSAGVRMRSRFAQAHANANLFGAYALFELGELGELARRVEGLLSDADQRGDLYTSINLRTTMVPMLALASDDPAMARRALLEAIAQWSQRAYLVQHMQTMVYQAWVELYEGDGPAAYARTERDWPALRRSFLLKVQFIRGFAFSARGRSAVAAAEQESKARRGELLQEARRVATKLEQEQMPWTSAHAAIVWAGIANVEGDRPRTLEALRTASGLGDAVDMPLLAAAARYRLGELLDGSEGAELANAARKAYADREVRNAARYARAWLPGRWQK